MFKNPAWGKTVAIVQSNYIPWIGYFNLIALSDVFVLLDDVQYTRRDWRNRNQIKTQNGLHWLTIPVDVKSKFTIRICDVTVSEEGWAAQHWKTIMHSYTKAPFFEENAPWVKDLYTARNEKYLSKVNHAFIDEISKHLGITTELKWSMDFSTPEEKSLRLLSICKQLNANVYLSGPGAKDYLDVEAFSNENIRVEWMDYSNYREYPQLYPPFIHQVSVLDLIFNTGKRACDYLRTSQ